MVTATDMFGILFNILLIGGVLISFFAYGAYKIYTAIKHPRREIENLPTSKIRSLAMGLVEIKGRVRPAGKTLKSPIGGIECVHYMLSVSVTEKTDFVGGRHIESVPFIMKDDTGEVLVDPEDADIRSRLHRHELSVDSKEKYPAFIKNGTKKSSLLSGVADYPTFEETSPSSLRSVRVVFEYDRARKIHCVEECIAIDDPLYVLGTAKRKPSAAGETNSDNIIISQERGNPFIITRKKEDDLLAEFFKERMKETAKGIALMTLTAGIAIILVIYI